MDKMLSKIDIECVMAYAKGNMRMTNASEILFMHRNSISYHLDKVKNKTGLDPRNFFDLAKLMECIKKGGGSDD